MRLPALASSVALALTLSACPAAPLRPEPSVTVLPPAELVPGAELDALAAAPSLEPLPAGAVLRLGATGLAHAQEIHHVALSPDGATAWSSAIYDREPMAWDTATGRSKGRLKLTREGQVEGLAVSPDGATLAVAKPDSVTLVTVATGAERLAIKGTDIVAVAWSPDGARLAIGHREGRLELIDAMSGKIRKALRGKDEMFADVAFSIDGSLVAASGGDAAYVWDAKTGAPRLRWHGKAGGYGNGIAWLGDGSLAVATSDKELAVFAATTLAKLGKATQPTSSIAVPGNISALGATPDGRLVIAGFGGRVSVVEPLTGAITKDLVGGEAPASMSYTNAMAVVGGRVVTGWESGRVRVFDVASGAESVQLAGHRARVEAVAWSSDGRFIATGGEDGTTILWRAGNGRQWRVLAPEADKDGRRAKVIDVAIQPKGTLVAVVTANNHLYVWDAATGAPVKHTTFSAPPTGLAWSPSGARLGVSLQSGNAYVIAVPAWKGLLDVTHDEGVMDVAFAGEDRIVTTLSSTLVVWDIATAKVLGERKRGGLRTQMNALAVSSDGKSAYTGGYGGFVDRWDLGEAAQVEPSPSVPMPDEGNGASNPVMALVAIPGGFVAGGSRGDVFVVRGDVRVDQSGHGGEVTDLAVSPDGTHAASASADMSVLVWKL